MNRNLSSTVGAYLEQGTRHRGLRAKVAYITLVCNTTIKRLCENEAFHVAGARDLMHPWVVLEDKFHAFGSTLSWKSISSK